MAAGCIGSPLPLQGTWRYPVFCLRAGRFRSYSSVSSLALGRPRIEGVTKNHSEHWSVHWPFVVALWLAALAVFVLVSAATSRTRLADELEVTGRTLHRLVSQRVAQHDAHLTSLIALTGGAEPAPEGAVRQVMESISRFYPRIAWLARGSTPEPVMARPTTSATTWSATRWTPSICKPRCCTCWASTTPA